MRMALQLSAGGLPRRLSEIIASMPVECAIFEKADPEFISAAMCKSLCEMQADVPFDIEPAESHGRAARARLSDPQRRRLRRRGVASVRGIPRAAQAREGGVVKRTAKDIGRGIADAGAMLWETDEARAVASAAARAIREERNGAIWLTKAEARAALEAISQMTDGNTRDFDEWKMCTHGTLRQWRALLSAEEKIRSAAQ